MKQVTVLIPLKYNDGREVPEGIFASFEREAASIAGGFSKPGLVDGGWLEGQELLRDTSRQYVIMAKRRNVKRIKALVMLLGHGLEQYAMYWDVRRAHTQFLRMDKPAHQGIIARLSHAFASMF